MGIILNAVQFVETSLLFSAFLFSLIMFVRTRDSLAGRTLLVVFPVAALLFISYMYGIGEQTAEIKDSGIGWLSPFFAFVVIILVVAAVLAACYYVVSISPGTKTNKKRGMIFAAVTAAAALIVTGVLVMYISKSDLTMAVANALWVFYPLCSVALFIEAVALTANYGRIKDERDKKLAKYFIIAFMPQVVFSAADFILLRNVPFQTTHLSYAAFSLLVFVDLSGYFFRSYGVVLDITAYRHVLRDRYELSDREVEVTELLAKGLTNQTIGDRLHISVNTVKSHTKKIYDKLGVSNRLQLMNALLAIRNGSK